MFQNLEGVKIVILFIVRRASIVILDVKSQFGC